MRRAGFASRSKTGGRRPLAHHHAAELGLGASGGSSRAESWQHAPIVRMVNVSLEPGPRRFEDLVREVDDGLLLCSPASYSLDDKRQNFHFSAQVARVIKRGEIQGHVRGVAFQSLTPDFWGRCDGAADDQQLHGFLSCAKGEPLQLNQEVPREQLLPSGRRCHEAISRRATGSTA